MELSGHRIIEAPRDRVWEALLDPEILKACIPGCTEMSGSPEDGVAATVVQKVGPVKATFRGRVALEDLERPDSLRRAGEGKGGAAGFAKGGAACRLSEAEAGATRLDYDVEAKVGGKLAQLGSRVIDGFARKMADQFFENFKTAVEGPAEPATAGSGPDPDAEAAPQKRTWFGRGRPD